MSDFASRMMEFVSQNSKSVRDFEARSGIAIGTIQKMGNGISTTSLTRIAKSFPDLDLYWLLLGEARDTPAREPEPAETKASMDKSMFEAIVAEKDKDIAWMRGVIASMQRTIDTLIEKGGTSVSQSVNR